MLFISHVLGNDTCTCMFCGQDVVDVDVCLFISHVLGNGTCTCTFCLYRLDTDGDQGHDHHTRRVYSVLMCACLLVMF